MKCTILTLSIQQYSHGSDSTSDRSLAAHQRIVNMSRMHRSRLVQILSHSIIITISLHSIYKTSQHCTAAIVNHNHSLYIRIIKISYQPLIRCMLAPVTFIKLSNAYWKYTDLMSRLLILRYLQNVRVYVHMHNNK